MNVEQSESAAAKRLGGRGKASAVRGQGTNAFRGGWLGGGRMVGYRVGVGLDNPLNSLNSSKKTLFTRLIPGSAP